MVGGNSYDGRVTEYNRLTNTWRNMPSLQRGRLGPSVCTLDNKIFVLGGNDTTCEVLDLSDDDSHWRYIAKMNSNHTDAAAVVIERKIYVLGGNLRLFMNRSVEVYDVNQGILMEYSLITIFHIYRSVEYCYDHAN